MVVPATSKTLWIARSHHRHMGMPAAPHFHNPLTSPLSTVPAAPAAPVVVRPHGRGSPPPGLEDFWDSCQAAPVKPSKWEHMLILQQSPAKGVQVLPQREPIMQSVQTHVRDVYLFQSLAPRHSPRLSLAIPNLTGSVTLKPLTVISCITNTVTQFFSGTFGPARRNSTNIITAACGRFHAVILQEASDHAPLITDQFTAYTGNTGLAILLNKETFDPNPAVHAFQEASSSKDTWSMVLLVVRGLWRRPSLSGTPTVTFCSVHIHNVVAKKRDAFTDLLRPASSTTSTAM